MVRHTKLHAIWGLLLLVVAGSPVSAGESPWYLEVKLGQTSLDADFGSRHSKFFDDRTASATVEGGYTFNRYLAVQVGYHELGEHQGSGSGCPDTRHIPCAFAYASINSIWSALRPDNSR